MKSHLLYSLVILSSFLLTHYFGLLVDAKTSSRDPFVIPPENIEHFAFGYAESLADSLWLRTIQDIEYCGSKNKEVSLKAVENKRSINSSGHASDILPPLAGDQKDELSKGSAAAAKCRKGWSFHMLDEITDLSPKFETIYMMGAPGLSILVDDREGAEIIFDKGIKALPKNWQIPYMAAYHALFETRKFDKAARLLEQVGRMGGPEWVYFLATRIYSRAGMAALGKSVIMEYIKGFPPDQVPERARQRLAEVEALLAGSDQDRAPSNKDSSKASEN